MHLLYLPNECNEGDQPGPRYALTKLQSEGVIDKLTIFSYQVIEKRLGNWEQTLAGLLKLIEAERPTSILIQHIGKHEFPDEFFQKITGLYPHTPPILSYDDSDVYGRLKKPLPKSVMHICQNSDVIFLVAAGKFANRFRKNGCKNICYLPNVASTTTFGKPWRSNAKRDFEVVMIANNTKSRIPFKSMPGAKQREKLAMALSHEFGSRFALYGKGWENNLCNQGPIDFLMQEQMMRKAWIRVGYGHFNNYEGYFSNSLPITLISGTSYVVKRTPGMENFVIDGYHCRMFESVKEAVEIVRDLISGPKEELIEMGQRGAKLAHTILNDNVRMMRLVSILKQYEKSHFRILRDH